MRHDLPSYAGSSAGQALVLVTALLCFLLIPLGLTVLALNAQQAAGTQLQDVVQDAARAAVTQLDDATLASGVALVDARAADAAARATLRAGFSTYGPRIDATLATSEATVSVQDASGQPASGPGPASRTPTVCVSASVSVGVLEYQGLAFTHHLYACSQMATP